MLITIKLKKQSYDLLKAVDLSEMGNNVKFYDDDLSFETSDIKLLLVILNEEIVTKGLDDSYDPTERGRELYTLYDMILDQIK